jgi:acyl-[acyl-carrier-protein] desaturase
MTRWEIDKITGLTDEAEKARDYLMKLPENDSGFRKNDNSSRVSYFKWVEPAKIVGFRWKNNKC